GSPPTVRNAETRSRLESALSQSSHAETASPLPGRSHTFTSSPAERGRSAREVTERCRPYRFGRSIAPRRAAALIRVNREIVGDLALWTRRAVRIATVSRTYSAVLAISEPRTTSRIRCISQVLKESVKTRHMRGGFERLLTRRRRTPAPRG